MSESSLLTEVRANLGGTPRRVHGRDAINIPFWAKGDPRFPDLKNDLKFLLREGTVAWGALVQANELMFRKGNQNCPGNVIFSFDAAIDDDPGVLIAAARELFAAKGAIVEDPRFQRIASELANERGPSPQLPVPLGMTRGIECVLGNVIFERKHLPGGVLVGNYFPLLVDRGSLNVMFVPERYWPERMRRMWL